MPVPQGGGKEVSLLGPRARTSDRVCAPGDHRRLRAGPGCPGVARFPVPADPGIAGGSAVGIPPTCVRHSALTPAAHACMRATVTGGIVTLVSRALRRKSRPHRPDVSRPGRARPGHRTPSILRRPLEDDQQADLRIPLEGRAKRDEAAAGAPGGHKRADPGSTSVATSRSCGGRSGHLASNKEVRCRR
jgi:hypothetical protein